MNSAVHRVKRKRPIEPEKDSIKPTNQKDEQTPLSLAIRQFTQFVEKKHDRPHSRDEAF